MQNISKTKLGMLGCALIACALSGTACCHAQSPRSQSVSVTVTTYGCSQPAPVTPVCVQQSVQSVQVTTQSLDWYKSATVTDKRPCAGTVVAAPTYVWQQSAPVVVVQQPVPVVQYYTQPIITVPILESSPVYYPSYYQSYSYWEYPSVYTERAHIDNTRYMYGFGGRHYGHAPMAPMAPQYFPPVRQLPQPRAGVPFPGYRHYGPRPMPGPSYGHRSAPFQSPHQSQQQPGPSHRGNSHRGHR